MQNCLKCGSELKLIPAGVSKNTGKPYGAFYKCNTCGFSQNAGQAPIPASPVKGVWQGAQAQRNEDDKWKKIREEKNDNISWMNAKNNACLIVSEMYDKDFSALDEMKNQIIDLANWIYRLEPHEPKNEPPFA